MAWHPIRRSTRKLVDALERRQAAAGAGPLRPQASTWALAGLDLFAGLPGDEVDALYRLARRTEVEARAPLVISDGAVHIVVEGGVKLMRVSALGRQLVVGLLGPGDVFGRVTAAETDESYVLEALEPSCILAIESAAFRGLMARTQFAYRVVQRLEDRERELVRRVESLVFKDVRTRLVETLLALADEHGDRCTHGMAVDVRINQQDLADLVGASRQMVNRALGELSRRLYVRKMGKTLCILNRERLAALVSTG